MLFSTHPSMSHRIAKIYKHEHKEDTAKFIKDIEDELDTKKYGSDEIFWKRKIEEVQKSLADLIAKASGKNKKAAQDIFKTKDLSKKT